MIVSATAMSPCKDCTDRCIGCHSACGDYAEYKKKREENRKKINAENEERRFYYLVKSELVKGYKKRRKGGMIDSLKSFQQTFQHKGNKTKKIVFKYGGLRIEKSA